MKKLWIKALVLPLFSLLFIATEASSQNCYNTIWYTINDYTVDFTDSSAGRNFTYWLWDFGDGNTSTDSMPTHIYTTKGRFSVTLKAGDSVAGCNSYSTVSFQVGCTVTPGYAIDRYTVSFKDSSKDWFNSWHWDFGDGNISSLRNPQHVYSDSGTYNVKFAAYNSYSACGDSVIFPLFVQKPTCKNRIFHEVTSPTLREVFFTDSSSGRNINYWKWDMGDGKILESKIRPDLYYRYVKGGTYLVQLVSGDTTTGCYDTSYVNVYTKKCIAKIGYMKRKYKVDFYGTYGYTYYYWDLGDGNYSTARNFSHIYMAPGEYDLVLYVEDTVKKCKDTVYQKLTLYDVNCTATIDYTVNDLEVSFKGGRIPAYPEVAHEDRWYWYFGDSARGKPDKHVSHKYSSYGSYNVRLITDNFRTHCRDTMDTVITLTPPPPSPSVIYGRIYVDTFKAEKAMVWLIEHDSTAGTLTAIDSVETDSNWNVGYFTFKDVDSGQYLLKAALLPASSKYNDYLPAYYGDELFWNNAFPANIKWNKYYNLNISLIPGNNPGGPGFIGGYISQGANKRKGMGDPLANVQVMLLDLSDVPVAYTYSDANGYFSFSDLALGTYKVYPEIIGKETEPAILTLTTQEPTGDTVWMQVDEKKVSTAIFSNYKHKMLKIYPNPANDILKIELPKNISNFEIKLTDIVGRAVFSKVYHFTGNELIINLSDLAAGSYLLWLTTQEKEVYQQKLFKTD